MDIGPNIHPSCLCLNCFPHTKHAKHFKAQSSIGYRTNTITENKPPQIHIKTSPVGVPAGEVHSYEKNGYKPHKMFSTQTIRNYIHKVINFSCPQPKMQLDKIIHTYTLLLLHGNIKYSPAWKCATVYQ